MSKKLIRFEDSEEEEGEVTYNQSLTNTSSFTLPPPQSTSGIVQQEHLSPNSSSNFTSLSQINPTTVPYVTSDYLYPDFVQPEKKKPQQIQLVQQKQNLLTENEKEASVPTVHELPFPTTNQFQPPSNILPQQFPLFTPPTGPPPPHLLKTEFTVQVIGDSGAKKFSNAYKDNFFEKLTLKGPKEKKKMLSLAGWVNLGNVLNSELGELYITDFYIDEKKAGYISSVILTSCPKIKIIDLWHNHINEDAAMAFVNNVINIKTLKKINLGDNDIVGTVKLKLKKLSKETGVHIDLW